MMSLLFTRSALPLSRLIRWGLREPVSHFAICFDYRIVFHSNLLGVHLESYYAFARRNEIVYALEVPATLEQEEAIYLSIDCLTLSGYSFGGLLFFMWSVLLSRLFGRPIPATNPWGDPDRFLCTELAEKVPEWICPRKKQIGPDLEMVSPYQLKLALLGE